MLEDRDAILCDNDDNLKEYLNSHQKNHQEDLRSKKYSVYDEVTIESFFKIISR